MLSAILQKLYPVEQSHKKSCTLGNWIYLNGTHIAEIQKPAEMIGVAEIRLEDGNYLGVVAAPHQRATPATSSNCGGVRGNGIAVCHFGGGNQLFTDGHVKWMKKSSLGDKNGNGVLDLVNTGWFAPNSPF